MHISLHHNGEVRYVKIQPLPAHFKTCTEASPQTGRLCHEVSFVVLSVRRVSIGSSVWHAKQHPAGYVDMNVHIHIMLFIRYYTQRRLDCTHQDGLCIYTSPCQPPSSVHTSLTPLRRRDKAQTARAPWPGGPGSNVETPVHDISIDHTNSYICAVYYKPTYISRCFQACSIERGVDLFLPSTSSAHTVRAEERSAPQSPEDQWRPAWSVLCTTHIRVGWTLVAVCSGHGLYPEGTQKKSINDVIKLGRHLPLPEHTGPHRPHGTHASAAGRTVRS